MRILGIVTAMLLFFTSISMAQQLSNKLDSLSYGIGVMMAQNFQREGINTLNADQVARGLSAVFGEQKLELDKAQALEIYKKAIEEGKKMKNQDIILEGEAYLAENGRKPGVTTTTSGLQYEVIASGEGPKPGPGDKVTTHYHGTLINGKVFDSSVDRGEPISFPVGGVIKGWQEALQLMSVGDKWRLTIPYSLAYGERGAGAGIPPYATLIFEVELLGIE